MPTMKPMGNKRALQGLDELVAEGNALLEARRNPAKAGERFADFGKAYLRWHGAGEDLIGELSGQRDAREWSGGWCRAMCTLDQDTAMCLKEHERQQAMLVELRQRLGPNLGTSAPKTITPEPRIAESASGRSKPTPGRIYELKPHHRNLTNEEMLEDLRRVAAVLGKKTVTSTEYPTVGRFNPATLARRFGTWNKAVAAAGLEASARRYIPTEDLFENLARVWETVGRQPVREDFFKPQSEFSMATYAARFGSWRRALEDFVAWARHGAVPADAAATPKTSRFPNARLRYAVLLRDCFKCTACGRSPATDPGVKLEIDHIIPWERSRLTTLGNLRTLCQQCNSGKANT